METVSFLHVLNAVARRCGIDPQTQLNGVQAEEMTDYINGAFRRGWEQEWWPDWTPTQACALTPESGAWPAGAGAYIDRTTGGAAPMGTIKCLFLRDPQGHLNQKPILDFQISQRGIELPRHVISAATAGASNYGGIPTVWVTFRLNPPNFTSVEWLTGHTYNAGDLVLRQLECWEANASTTADPNGSIGAGGSTPPWAIQAFPKTLERFVVAQAAAEALAMMDRPAAANAQTSKASEALEEELTKRGIQQGQTRRYRVRVR